MLASPLYPSPSFSPRQSNEDATQYRPAKDMEAFNSLLPPAIEFVEGSSSGALILGEGKYEPINGSPMAKPEVSGSSHPRFVQAQRVLTFVLEASTILF
jgi:ubiquitin carboxyl-terminal hydrolase 36/42